MKKVTVLIREPAQQYEVVRTLLWRTHAKTRTAFEVTSANVATQATEQQQSRDQGEDPLLSMISDLLSANESVQACRGYLTLLTGLYAQTTAALANADVRVYEGRLIGGQFSERAQYRHLSFVDTATREALVLYVWNQHVSETR